MDYCDSCAHVHIWRHTDRSPPRLFCMSNETGTCSPSYKASPKWWNLFLFFNIQSAWKLWRDIQTTICPLLRYVLFILSLLFCLYILPFLNLLPNPPHLRDYISYHCYKQIKMHFISLFLCIKWIVGLNKHDFQKLNKI